jgi:hypothetical protein
MEQYPAEGTNQKRGRIDCRPNYSHPHVWWEIGLGGSAYPPGCVRVELDLADTMNWQDTRLSAAKNPLHFGHNNSGRGVKDGALHFTCVFYGFRLHNHRNRHTLTDSEPLR